MHGGQLVREELPAETVRTQERAKLEGLPASHGNVPSRGANIERKSGSCFARKRREREVGTSMVEVQSYDWSLSVEEGGSSDGLLPSVHRFHSLLPFGRSDIGES